MAKRGTNRFKRERRDELANRDQGVSPGRATVVDPIRPKPTRNNAAALDRRPRLAGSVDRVAEAKGLLDRLDTPLRDTFGLIRLNRWNTPMDAGKALAAHKAVQSQINSTPTRPNQRRNSDMGSLSPLKAKIKQDKTEPVRSPKVREETNTCKPRPVNNQGMGGSRNFVPWCGRKK